MFEIILTFTKSLPKNGARLIGLIPEDPTETEPEAPPSLPLKTNKQQIEAAEATHLFAVNINAFVKQ